MTSLSSDIRVGSGKVPVRRAYPWDRLEKKGDYFRVKGKGLEKSIRAQASKQGRKRGVTYAVQRTEKGTKVILVGMKRSQ